MEPSSRTPEGEPNRCAVCGHELRIEPSVPPGDAPCPYCGNLVWFDAKSADAAADAQADLKLEPVNLEVLDAAMSKALSPGTKVRITSGPFHNYEGTLDAVDEAQRRVTILVNVFGQARPVNVLYGEIT